jgi:hypothetical protein
MYPLLRVIGLIAGLAGCGWGQTCGIERWSVKTGTDADSRLVNVSSATATTIANLTGLPAPSSKPDNSRVQPTETTVFVMNAVLTQYKFESDDSDYHLVLSD